MKKKSCVSLSFKNYKAKNFLDYKTQMAIRIAVYSRVTKSQLTKSKSIKVSRQDGSRFWEGWGGECGNPPPTCSPIFSKSLSDPSKDHRIFNPSWAENGRSMVSMVEFPCLLTTMTPGRIFVACCVRHDLGT